MNNEHSTSKRKGYIGFWVLKMLQGEHNMIKFTWIFLLMIGSSRRGSDETQSDAWSFFWFLKLTRRRKNKKSFTPTVQRPNPFLQVGFRTYLLGLGHFSDIGWAFPQRRKLSNGPFNNPNPCSCSGSKPVRVRFNRYFWVNFYPTKKLIAWR